MVKKFLVTYLREETESVIATTSLEAGEYVQEHEPDAKIISIVPEVNRQDPDEDEEDLDDDFEDDDDGGYGHGV